MIPVTLMMATTLDGKIAKNNNHFPDWTSKEDKQLFFKISKKHQVILMGEKTFRTLPSPLPNRLNVVFSMNEKHPKQKNVKWVKGDPIKVLEELKNDGYKSALLGGGTFLNSLFLEKKLINEIIITIEPRIFGSGLSLFDGDFNYSLELKELNKLNNNSYFVKYKINY